MSQYGNGDLKVEWCVVAEEVGLCGEVECED